MELLDFLTTIWGEGEGTVCTSFKTQEVNEKGEPIFEDVYWKYPLEVGKIPAVVESRDAKGDDCYFIPVVLRGASRKKVAFQQSSVAWVDLDAGGHLAGDPSVLVESSPGNMHAYWLFEAPVEDVRALEDTNRGLQALCGADKSGWDATQLLRLPFTHSKKRNCPVVLKDLSSRKHTLGALPKWNAPLLNLVPQS